MALLSSFMSSISDPRTLMMTSDINWIPVGDIQWRAFEMVLSNQAILMGYVNTVIYVIGNTAVGLTLTMIAGYVLSCKTKLRVPFTVMILLTMFLSGGLIPSYIVNMSLGLIDNRWAVIIPGATNAFWIIIMKNAFDSLPASYSESAKLDGAGPVRIMINILLPLVKSTIAVLAMFMILMRWNSWFLIFLLPSAATLLLAVFGAINIITLAIFMASIIPLGGALSACFFCISSIVRDEPIFVWYDFKRKLRENFKKAIIPGIIYIIFIYGQILILFNSIIQEIEISTALIIISSVFFFLFRMILPYVFLQIAYIDIGLPKILPNSMIIAFMNLKRSFMGALMSLIIYISVIWILPWHIIMLPFIIFFGISLSWLFSIMWAWPIMDKQFSITNTLRKQHEDSE